jgi:transposase
MSAKEARWLQLLELVREGRLSLREAASKMGLGYRQTKRLRKRLAIDGPRGSVHRSRGRDGPNRLDRDVWMRIVTLAQERNGSFNDTHLAEMPAEREGIRVSRECVRRLLRAAGLPAKRTRQVRRHHRRRPRKAQAGMMMLWDGSPHAWFGPRRAACCLMAAMDDATSTVLAPVLHPTDHCAQRTGPQIRACRPHTRATQTSRASSLRDPTSRLGRPGLARKMLRCTFHKGRRTAGPTQRSSSSTFDSLCAPTCILTK